MNNVILIGMPSCGKSTVGVLLAKMMGFGFIDSDLLIQGEEGKRLCEIIGEKGTEGFIRTEERVNAGLFAERCVIATGGSAVYSERAMKHLKSLGTVVYLKVDEDDVKRRIPSFDERGVVMRGNITTVEELYKERAPLYEKYADVTVERRGKDVEETAREIIERINRSA